MNRPSLFMLAAACVLSFCGCSLIVPQVAHRPVIRNPFPQLSRVAIAPFFNQSDEPTLDGRQVALSYFAELQSTPGFEVVPLGVVEEAIIANRVDLNGQGEARRLAKILGVDVVVVGAITDFSEYYPPRVGLRVEWYTANPGFHEIPAGYGLPWGTPEEEFIPDSLVYESQLALAKAEFAAKTPDCEGVILPLPPPPAGGASGAAGADGASSGAKPQSDAVGESAVEDSGDVGDADQEGDEAAAPAAPTAAPDTPAPDATTLRIIDSEVRLAQAEEELPAAADTTNADSMNADAASEAPASTDTTVAGGDAGALPLKSAQAPDPQCLTAPAAPAAASMERPVCIPWHGPVLSHTRIYRGNDADVTEALEGYVSFRDDHRFGGWKSYLARSDDFIRFCCHLHISEMLSARGGSRKTDVVLRWPDSR